MRAGPLSNTNVIALLNRCFVPVYLSNEDYRKAGPASPEERKELQRIFNEGYAAKLSVGTVHVYVVAPDGHLFDSMHVAAAARTDKLLAMLERAVQKLGPTPGPPVIQPGKQSQPPKHEPDALVLHLTARGNNQGSWREFPGENWILMNRADWTKLLPGETKVGSSWEIESGVAAKLLTHFHPQTEDPYDKDRNRIDQRSLKATVISVQGGAARARLEGNLRMKRTFYPGKEDDKFVDATVIGYLDFDTGRNQTPTVWLVTDVATYGKEGFRVAVRSEN
jgi:hypothetical protein